MRGLNKEKSVHIHTQEFIRSAREFRKYLIQIFSLLALALAAGTRAAAGAVHERSVVGTARLEVLVEAG